MIATKMIFCLAFLLLATLAPSTVLGDTEACFTKDKSKLQSVDDAIKTCYGHGEVEARDGSDEGVQNENADEKIVNCYMSELGLTDENGEVKDGNKFAAELASLYDGLEAADIKAIVTECMPAAPKKFVDMATCLQDKLAEKCDEKHKTY